MILRFGVKNGKPKKRSATIVVERFFVFGLWSEGLTMQIIIPRRRLFFNQFPQAMIRSFD
ncbi:hypothetical protein P5G61_00720 [Paenibacillus sp. F6_3S_P_1C]|uniref:Uncharacterized protein n=1 Tax=Paenibacillus vandeheii TaxID=3035917 RepID=A0ABT8J3S3_9BACL|nr:hypothetical protein [Paenibacillus vandeheii]MDN4599734.1 hypothetical protein [Paenibacillus vandeheii]